MLNRFLQASEAKHSPIAADAHCDLFCGVYDPIQAKLEAEAVKNCMVKYHDSDDEVFRMRAIIIKEQCADLVKHHLWVLWTDYFKPPHVEQFPQIHDLFWRATKQAGETKKTVNVEDADKLLELIEEISVIFWETKKA